MAIAQIPYYRRCCLSAWSLYEGEKCAHAISLQIICSVGLVGTCILTLYPNIHLY